MTPERRKQTVWKTPEGKRCKKSDPGAVPHETESKLWYARDGDDWIPLSRIKSQAAEMLREIMGKRYRAEAGIPDPLRDAEAIPLSDHIDDWHAELTSRENNGKYVELCVGRCRKIFRALKWTRLSDMAYEEARDAIDALKVGKPVKRPVLTESSYRPGVLAKLLGLSGHAIAKRADSVGVPGTGKGKARRFTLAEAKEIASIGSGRGIGQRTVNHYRNVLVMFGSWLVDSKRLADNPFTQLKAIKVTKLLCQRTNLTPDEVCRLLASTKASPRSRGGLTGLERYWLYRLAILTAFRPRTLSTLTAASFSLGALPTVTVGASQTKNAKAKVQPVPASVAADLKLWLAGREGPIWGTMWRARAAIMFRMDVREAGMTHIRALPDGSPAKIDFYGLRHTGITLASAYLDFRSVQEHAGHASPVMTANYVHPGHTGMRSGIDSLDESFGETKGESS